MARMSVALRQHRDVTESSAVTRSDLYDGRPALHPGRTRALGQDARGSECRAGRAGSAERAGPPAAAPRAGESGSSSFHRGFVRRRSLMTFHLNRV